MIGNDVVDWAQAKRDSNWQRKGFLAKVFTEAEQQLIRRADEPERMVWTLWCLKESVYKADVRTTGKRVMAPSKIACALHKQSHDQVEGIAIYNNVYRIYASLTPNYVLGRALQHGRESVFREVVCSIGEVAVIHQSAHMRHCIQAFGAATFAVPLSNIHVRKDELGIPNLLLIEGACQQSLPISISHHGQYGALLIDYTNRPVNSR